MSPKHESKKLVMVEFICIWSIHIPFQSDLFRPGIAGKECQLRIVLLTEESFRTSNISAGFQAWTTHTKTYMKWLLADAYIPLYQMHIWHWTCTSFRVLESSDHSTLQSVFANLFYLCISHSFPAINQLTHFRLTGGQKKK